MSRRSRQRAKENRIRKPSNIFVNEHTVVNALLGHRDNMPANDFHTKRLDFKRKKPDFRILLSMVIKDSDGYYSDLVRACVHWNLYRLYAVLRLKKKKYKKKCRSPDFSLLQIAATSGNAEFYRCLVEDKVIERSTGVEDREIAEYFGLIESTKGVEKLPDGCWLRLIVEIGIQIKFDGSKESLYAFKKLLRHELPWEEIVPLDAYKYWEGLYRTGKVPLYPYYRALESKRINTRRLIRYNVHSMRKDILKHNIFKLYNHYDTFRFEMPKSTDDVCYISPESFVTEDMVGMHSVVDQDTFIRNFHRFSNNTFVEFNWDNVVVIGGSVAACLTENFDTLGDIDTDHYILNKYGDSDIDIYLYGLDIRDDYENKIVEIARSFFKAHPQCKIIQTPNTYTFVFGWPVRHVQLILSNFESLNHVIFGSDIQATGVVFDGRDLWTTDCARIAYNRRWTLITQETFRIRGILGYENRCVKYSRRGFQIVDLKLNRLDIPIDTIYESITPEMCSSNKLKGHELILYYIKYPEAFTNRPKPVICFEEGITVEDILNNIEIYSNEPFEYQYGYTRPTFKLLHETSNIPCHPPKSLEYERYFGIYSYFSLQTSKTS